MASEGKEREDRESREWEWRKGKEKGVDRGREGAPAGHHGRQAALGSVHTEPAPNEVAHYRPSSDVGYTGVMPIEPEAQSHASPGAAESSPPFAQWADSPCATGRDLRRDCARYSHPRVRDIAWLLSAPDLDRKSVV